MTTVYELSTPVVHFDPYEGPVASFGVIPPEPFRPLAAELLDASPHETRCADCGEAFVGWVETIRQDTYGREVEDVEWNTPFLVLTDTGVQAMCEDCGLNLA